MSKVEELSKAILRDLLADFTDHNLTANDLTNGYDGVTLPALKQRCCGETSASPVDFDLALKDLEEGDLVKTGPMVPYENTPGSQVVILAIYSKREFVYLTEKGYKAAQKSTTKPRSPVPSVHISGGNFHQSPIGIGSTVTQSLAGTLGDAPVFMELHKAIENVSNEGDRANLIAGVEAMEKAHKTPAFVSRYADFIALAANHMTIITPFIPALTALLSGK